MKIINEELKGLNTFRGLGFVDYDGILVPVCGQVLLDFGNGCTVRYIDQQIKRMMKPQPTVRGVVRGTISLVEDPTDSYCRFLSTVGNYFLLPGTLEDIPMGMVNWETGKTQLCAPFRFRVPDTLQRAAIDDIMVIFSDPYAPAVNSSWMNEATTSFLTEIFIPGA